MKRIQCPCCGYYTIENDMEVVLDICEVCFWQYDVVAHDKSDISIGSNKISLENARINYRQYGICKPELIGRGLTRKPLSEELPENNIV